MQKIVTLIWRNKASWPGTDRQTPRHAHLQHPWVFTGQKTPGKKGDVPNTSYVFPGSDYGQSRGQIMPYLPRMVRWHDVM